MFRRKSVLLLLAVLVAFGMLSVSGSYQGVQAGMSGPSYPEVTVLAGGSITVTPSGMVYGSRAMGDVIHYNTDSPNHVVALIITTNTTDWKVECSKSQDLKTTSPIHTIPSANFIYTSSATGGTPLDADVYSSQQFGDAGTPSPVTDTPATPAAANALTVDVKYDLTIGSAQEHGDYTATHTYTLTAS